MTTMTITDGRGRRVLLAALGVACTGLAVLGAILPGLPMTVFLIAAGSLFARSSPRLDRRLRRSRRFGPILRRLAESEGMPRRTKRAAILSMWTGIAVSLAALGAHPALQAATGGLGIAGTAYILWRVPTAPDPGALR